MHNYTMKNLITLLLLSLMIVSCGSDSKKEKNTVEADATTTYYLIRHAEKNRSSETPDDPELMETGQIRANRWASYFEDIELDAVYSTDYKRTLQTAAPVAKQKGLAVQSYDPRKLYDSLFQRNTKGKAVLVVGHSNTTPAFVNTIIGENKYPSISDSENGMLYQVTLSKNGQAVEINKIE